MKKQFTKSLIVLILLLAVVAGAFSCLFFGNDVAVAATLPDEVASQWFDGADYNDFDTTLKTINKMLNGMSEKEKSDFKQSPVAVCVIDTGINASHELFDGVLYDSSFWYCAKGNKSFTEMRGETYINDTCANGSLVGHGTHVSGIVAQEIKKYGLEDYIKILPVKASSDGRFSSADVVRAINYVAHLAETENISAVINMSLTQMIYDNDKSSWGEGGAIDNAIQSAAQKGVIVCAAAGNDDYNSDVKIGSPACLDNVIGVMGYGENFATDFNYGTAYDISAPGIKVLSAAKNGEKEPYCKKSGTSMACPFVSFAAAVLEIRYARDSASVYDAMTSTPSVATGKITYGKGVYTARKLNLSAFIEFSHVKEIDLRIEENSEDALRQNITSPKEVNVYATLRYYDETEDAPETDTAYKGVQIKVVKAGADGKLSSGQVVLSVDATRYSFVPTEAGTYYIYASNSAYIGSTSECVKVIVEYAEKIEDAKVYVSGKSTIREGQSFVYSLQNAYMLDPDKMILWSVYDKDGTLCVTKVGEKFTFSPEEKGVYKIVCTVGGDIASEFTVKVKTDEKTVRIAGISGGVAGAAAVAAVAVLVVILLKKKRI